MGPLLHPIIILHNVPYEDLKAVISFIYKGQCMVSKQQIPSLLSVAKLLKIQGLCDMKVFLWLNQQIKVNRIFLARREHIEQRNRENQERTNQIGKWTWNKYNGILFGKYSGKRR